MFMSITGHEKTKETRKIVNLKGIVKKVLKQNEDSGTFVTVRAKTSLVHTSDFTQVSGSIIL